MSCVDRLVCAWKHLLILSEIALPLAQVSLGMARTLKAGLGRVTRRHRGCLGGKAEVPQEADGNTAAPNAPPLCQRRSLAKGARNTVCAKLVEKDVPLSIKE